MKAGVEVSVLIPLSILLALFLKVKFLDHMTIFFLKCEEPPNGFPQCYFNSYSQPQCTRLPICKHTHQYFFTFICYSNPRGCTKVSHHGKAFGLVHTCPEGHLTQGSVHTNCTLSWLTIASAFFPCDFDLYLSSDEWHVASSKMFNFFS